MKIILIINILIYFIVILIYFANKEKIKKFKYLIIILLIYNGIISSNILHIRLVNLVDKGYLRYFIEQYINKYKKLPNKINELHKIQKNYKFYLKTNILYNLNLNIKYKKLDNNHLKIIIYENGYNRKNDNLKKIVNNPIYLLLPFVPGDIKIMEFETSYPQKR